MKQKKRNQNLTIYHTEAPLYPNAADHHYVIRKILNIMTAIVSGVGLMTAMLALVTLT